MSDRWTDDDKGYLSRVLGVEPSPPQELELHRDSAGIIRSREPGAAPRLVISTTAEEHTILPPLEEVFLAMEPGNPDDTRTYRKVLKHRLILMNPYTAVWESHPPVVPAMIGPEEFETLATWPLRSRFYDTGLDPWTNVRAWRETILALNRCFPLWPAHGVAAHLPDALEAWNEIYGGEWLGPAYPGIDPALWFWLQTSSGRGQTRMSQVPGVLFPPLDQMKGEKAKMQLSQRAGRTRSALPLEGR